MTHLGAVITAERGRGVEQGCQQILLDVADAAPGCFQAVEHILDVAAGQLVKPLMHQLQRVLLAGNREILAGNSRNRPPP